METIVVIHEEEPVLNLILPEVDSEVEIFDDTHDDTFE
jgi:hypothetical protein